MQQKQLKLFSGIRTGTDFGGDLGKGRRKIARPIAVKKQMHLVLKSSRATGHWSFLRSGNRFVIKAILDSLAKRYGIRVIGFENVGSHLHLLIQGKKRVLLQSFLRCLPSKIALAITKAKKGNPQGRFFDFVAFSRLVEWGRDLNRLKRYFWKNQLETNGAPADLVERWRNLAKTLPA